MIGDLIALGRAGLCFTEIGTQLGMCAANVHYHWHRKATVEDRGARDIAIILERPKSRRGAQRLVAKESAPLGIVSEVVIRSRFENDPRAVSDRGSPMRLGRPEPFGFSLYGGTLG